MFSGWRTVYGECTFAKYDRSFKIGLSMTVAGICVVLVFAFRQLYMTKIRKVSDAECRIFGLAWTALLLIDIVLAQAQMIICTTWQITFCRTLISDLIDLMLAWFLCNILRNMERDVQTFSRGEKWVRRSVYLIAFVLAVLSGLRLVDAFVRNGLNRHQSVLWWWSYYIYAYTYLFFICGILMGAIKLKQQYDPSNKEEYLVPLWTLRASIAILIRVLLVLLTPLAWDVLRRWTHSYGKRQVMWFHIVEMLIWILFLNVIFIASQRIGYARDASGMIPNSLQSLGRQGAIQLR